MLGLLPTLVLIFLALAVVLWAVTLFLQGYIYSEPVSQIYWRAPLAGLILTLFLAFWCYLDYHSPGRYGAILDVSTIENEDFTKFVAIKKGREILFEGTKTPRGRMEYRAQGKPWSRSDAEGVVEAIVVEDKDHQKIRFDAELTPDGKFKAAQGKPVRYIEVDGQGRVMTDDSPGRVSVVRGGRIVGNLLLNLLLLGFWFAGLWLLLRFQWSHALGLAIVAWIVLTLIVLPALFKKTEDLAKQAPTAATTAASLQVLARG